MILSLVVYTFLAMILYIIGKFTVYYDNKSLRLSGHSSRFLNWTTVFAILIFAIVCGVRYNVGVDNLMYINEYISLQQFGYFHRETFEPLFGFLANVFVDMGLHYSVFMGFWAAVQIFFVYYAMRNDKYLLPYVALFIVLGSTFLSWTNGLRQCVVGCIFIFLIEYIVQRKFWKYVIVLLICSFIHRSAIILLPFYFIFQKPIIPRRKLIWVFILIACAIIGMTPTWLGIMNNFKGILAFLDYGTYAERLSYIVKNADEVMAWGPARIGIFLLDLFAVWYYPHIKKRYKLNKRFDIYFFAFFMGVCLFNLLANTSHIFIRPISYFRDHTSSIRSFSLFHAL